MRGFIALCVLLATQTVAAPNGATYDESLPPGANYDKAEFRFWIPKDAGPVRAVVVLVPGSNGDGRPMADDVFWKEFAVKQRVALLACRFTDKAHDQSFIEEYVNVGRGSGQAVLDVLAKFAARASHPEAANAPLLMWGMSAGGQFNFEFVGWKPERVAAFIVNKGGIYYSALLPKAAREVPGLLFVGEKDLQSRIDTITGLFAVNRRGGARWALVVEPGAAHVVGQSKDFGAVFFEEILTLRTGAGVAGAGFVGDLKSQTYQPAADAGTPGTPNNWFASERIAKTWQMVVKGS